MPSVCDNQRPVAGGREGADGGGMSPRRAARSGKFASIGLRRLWEKQACGVGFIACPVPAALKLPVEVFEGASGGAAVGAALLMRSTSSTIHVLEPLSA
jgi:hypothetical protein